MELFNIIAGVCSIFGLLVTLFTANKVYRISQQMNNNVKQVKNDLKDSMMAGGDINGLSKGK